MNLLELGGLHCMCARDHPEQSRGSRSAGAAGQYPPQHCRLRSFVGALGSDETGAAAALGAMHTLCPRRIKLQVESLNLEVQAEGLNLEVDVDPVRVRAADTTTGSSGGTRTTPGRATGKAAATPRQRATPPPPPPREPESEDATVPTLEIEFEAALATAPYGDIPRTYNTAKRFYVILTCRRQSALEGIWHAPWEWVALHLPGRKLWGSGAKLRGFDSLSDAIDHWGSHHDRRPWRRLA